MRVRGVSAGCLAALVLTVAGDASAQGWMSGGGPGPRRGSVEVSGGALWAAGYDLGRQGATLTRNPPTGSSPFQLFSSRTELQAKPGAQARIAVYLTRAIALEGGLQYSRPVLSTRLSDDAEGADSITATGPLTRYVFDGSAVLHLLRFAFAEGRGVPFVSGGAGYLRELHRGNELLETGTEIHGSAGVKIWFGAGKRRIGLRAEGGMTSRSGGFDFKDGRRTLPTAGASMLLLF